MVFLDLVLMAFLGYAGYKGIKNGLFVELSSFLSLIIGLYFALKISSFIRAILVKLVSWSPITVQFCAFIIAFILVLIGINMLSKVFTKLFSLAHLGWLNQLGGAVFSILKITVLLGVVLALILKINYRDVLISKKTQENSYLIKPIVKTSDFLLPVLSDWFKSAKGFVANANAHS